VEHTTLNGECFVKNVVYFQINGTSFWTKNKMAKKKVYDMPKGVVIKQYKFMIKNLKKDLEVTEKRLNKLKLK
jgi:hypothetical protein